MGNTVKKAGPSQKTACSVRFNAVKPSALNTVYSGFVDKPDQKPLFH